MFYSYHSDAKNKFPERP